MRELIIKPIKGRQIVIEVDFSKMELPENQQALVDNYWRERTAQNSALTLGDAFCVDSVEEQEDLIKINLKKSNYAHYLYVANHEEGVVNGCPVCYGVALIETKDGKYVLGRMSHETAAPRRVQLSGGGIEKCDIDGTRVQLERNVLREMNEELYIKESEIERFEPKYLREGGFGDFVAVVYKCKLNIEAEFLLQRYQQNRAELAAKGLVPEFADLIIITKNLEEIQKLESEYKADLVDYLLQVLKEEFRELLEVS